MLAELRARLVDQRLQNPIRPRHERFLRVLDALYPCQHLRAPPAFEVRHKVRHLATLLLQLHELVPLQARARLSCAVRDNDVVDLGAELLHGGGEVP